MAQTADLFDNLLVYNEGWKVFWRGSGDLWGVTEEKFRRFMRLRERWLSLTAEGSLYWPPATQTRGWERELRAIEVDWAWIPPDHPLNGWPQCGGWDL